MIPTNSADTERAGLQQPVARGAVGSTLRFAAVLMAGLLIASMATAADLDRKIQFDIPLQTPLDQALIEWGRLSGIQVMIAARTVAQKKSQGLHGLLTPREALRALLQDTGLTYTIEGRTLRVATSTGESSRPPDSRTGPPAAASADSAEQATARGRVATPAESSQATGRRVLEEVVVTGSNIGGAVDPVSPVKAYTRAEIDQTGLGTVSAFIQSLPQNFNGGKSDATVGGLTGGIGVNATNGTAVNLRGVGSNASLVLINGRRLSAADLDGDFIDISMIPLAALDRVEVVTDGASAIYGSDAVGGVVNFIMRRDFDGAETRLRYGSVTDGSHHDTQLAQTFGHVWGDGSALISYEYENSTPLNASDRGYTDINRAQGPFTLLSEQNREGVFISAEQAAGSVVSVFGDALFGHRNTFSEFTADGLSQKSPASTSGVSATVGLRADVLTHSRLEVSSTFGRNFVDVETLNLEANGVATSDLRTDTGIWSLDGKLNGQLGTLPSGAVLYAIGAQFRKESLDALDRLGETRFERDRRISAAFLELRIPLLGPRPRGSGPERLELSLAGRSEHYSDFGEANNPQLGLVWHPLTDLKIRGTYGTSFKAPVLSSLNPHLDTVIPLPEPDPLSQGTTNTLVLFGGGNPHLKPEKARTWTTGLDWAPDRLPGLRASLSYYGIHYTNRIVSASDSVGLFNLLQDASVLGSSVVQRNVPGAQIETLVHDPSFLNPFSIDPASISTVANYTIPENLSVVTTSGVDVDLAYAHRFGSVQTEMGVEGTRILRFRNQFTTNSPALSVLNTVFNPLDLRTRLRWVMQVAGLNGAVFLNYTGSYTDDRSGTPVPVASWATVDLAASYTFASPMEPLHGVSLTLSAINVADRDPPHIIGNANTQDIINYDGANANPLGRFVSLQVSKRW